MKLDLARKPNRHPASGTGVRSLSLGFAAGVEDVITSDDNLTQANELYWHFVAVNPGRVVLLCDRACVLARSDRLDAMIELTY